MLFFKNKKFRVLAAFLSIIGLVVTVGVVYHCKKKESHETHPAKSEPEGITFLNIGENTRFTTEIRDQLRDKLGPDAVEERNTLDLTLNYKGFLETHFPRLYELNKKLNFPVGERVEHNTIKLTYRYSQNRNVPFEYVELVFSNTTQKPLYFFIKFRKDGAQIIDEVTKKYGKPNTIQWDRKGGRSLYWEKNRSVLILSISNDRHGRPEYHIRIYYVPGLEDLVSSERQKIQHQQEKIQRTGKTVF
jgi:hypothetical protein